MIRCIVAALERYMSHPWLIEKIQILVWHKHLHCSLIDDLTISLWHGFHSRNILWCVAAWCWNNTHVKCWWYLLVDTDIQRKAERAGKRLKGTFQVLDGNILMLVHPSSGDNIFYKVRDGNCIILIASFGNEPQKEVMKNYILKKKG